MDAQLIIAVETAGLTAIAGPVVATAIAYMNDAVEPVFRYEQTSGSKINNALLRDPKNIPENLRKTLKEYLVRSCVGVSYAQRDAAYIREHGLEVARLKAANVAVLRLFERLADTRPDLKAIGLENIQVLTSFAEPLEDVPPVIRQEVYTGGSDWRVNSALVLSQDRHREAMALLEERHPKYGFAQHQGEPTLAHRRAIKQHGTTSDHR
jgi:ribonuclease HII